MTIYTQALDVFGNVNNTLIQAQDGDLIYWIPNDDGNVQWIEYQAWLGQGNQPNPPPSKTKSKDSK